MVAAWDSGSSETSLEIFGNTAPMNMRHHIGLLNLANDIEISWHFSEESGLYTTENQVELVCGFSIVINYTKHKIYHLY